MTPAFYVACVAFIALLISFWALGHSLLSGGLRETHRPRKDGDA